jgi:hypothetical protein
VQRNDGWDIANFMAICTCLFIGETVRANVRLVHPDRFVQPLRFSFSLKLFVIYFFYFDLAFLLFMNALLCYLLSASKIHSYYALLVADLCYTAMT